MGEIVDDDTDPVQEHGTNPSVAPDASAAPDGFDFGAAEDHPEETTTERIARLDGVLAIAATKGSTALKEAWAMVNADDKRLMKASLDRRHKRTAAEADKAEATG